MPSVGGLICENLKWEYYFAELNDDMYAYKYEPGGNGVALISQSSGQLHSGQLIEVIVTLCPNEWSCVEFIVTLDHLLGGSGEGGRRGVPNMGHGRCVSLAGINEYVTGDASVWVLQRTGSISEKLESN